ncbi:ABC transporter G family member [Arachis hypogaea]|nr:ABC transporter G family member [Arachis hypogaea]
MPCSLSFRKLHATTTHRRPSPSCVAAVESGPAAVPTPTAPAPSKLVFIAVVCSNSIACAPLLPLPQLDGNKRKPILQGLTGYAQPGKLLAIMGPSGCGKSTLLDALSGRLSSSVKQTGKILINGHKQALAYGTSGYVTQDDAMLSTLTAGETLYYSAQLQFPDSMSTSEKKEQADITLREMGLQDAIDTRVGGWGTQQVTHRGNKEGREELLVVLLSHIQILRVTIKRVNRVSRLEIRGGMEGHSLSVSICLPHEFTDSRERARNRGIAKAPGSKNMSVLQVFGSSSTIAPRERE